LESKVIASEFGRGITAYMPPSSARGVSPVAKSGPVAFPVDTERGLEALLHDLRGMVYRCRNDREWTALFVSAGCRELTGYPAEKFLGPGALHFNELIHPEDRDAVRESVQESLAARRPFELRYRIRTAHGEEKWVSERGRGVFSESGALEVLEGFVTDITELKRTEAVLREHDTMLSLAFRNAREMMLLARVEPGPIFRVQSVNRRYVDVVRAAGIKVTADEVIGLTFSELRTLFPFSEFTWEAMMKRYRSVVETKTSIHYEESSETPHGQFFGQSTISPVCDDAGVCRFVLYASSDVTDRKRAEEALRESEEKFAKAFQASPGAMAITEPGGRGFIEVNDGFTRMFGYDRSEVIGHRSDELGLWVVAGEREQFSARLRQEGSVSEMEVRRRRKDGSEIVCLLSAEPLALQGRSCLVVSFYDITDRKRAEAALRESEEKFAKAFHASAGAMSISEPGGRGFVEVNDGYVRMFGYTREELIGRSIGELQMWGSAEEQERFAQAFGAKQSIHGVEVVRRRRDGSLITCLLSAEPIELGGRSCVLSSLYDITARRQAEQALRDSEERFSKAFRAVPDAVFITEFETGRVVDANEGCLKTYGYSRADCIGRRTEELGVWADLQDRTRLLEALRAGGGTARNLEVTGRTREGGIVNVLISCETIELHGRAHLVTIAHDITERKRAEQALRDSEMKFVKAFRASPGAIGISDLETMKFVEVNDGYCGMFGYTREEMVGSTGLELGLWANLDERTRFVDQFQARGKVDDMEMVGRRRDGTLINCVLRAEKLELGGRSHIVSALNDITARRRSETQRAALEAQLRQTQKLDALGQLAGGIAHDFNNILTGISAYTELALLDADRPDDVRSHLAQVRRASERATDLVRQILTFSRQTPQERKPTRLHVVLREALKLLRSSIPKSITIVDQLDPLAPVVLADPSQIHQVVMNLCTNAAHAMRDRPGRLTVKLGTLRVDASGTVENVQLEPGTYARITVSDTGHGMDEATLGRIFEPFFTTKGPGEGTGLGLSVVHGIVEDHDGVISVRSKPGEGTSFELCFPEHSAVVTSELESNAELPRGNAERILFLDDESTISAAAAQLLKIIGYRVTAFTDPRQAWAAFDAAPLDFDIVVTDLTMPHLTGLEITRRVLAKRPDIPVLIATGQSVPWTPESIRSLGVRGLIAKPLTVAKLARTLRDALSGARS
jgi:two-component system cell cycle sensor histidine kinase/response regulator CckA